MKAQTILRSVAFAAALAAGVLGLPAERAWADDSPLQVVLQPGGASVNRTIKLGVDKSVVVELPRPAGDVLVSNPEIADAVLRTSTRLYLIGVKAGQANVFLFDGAGEQIASLDVYVEVDLTALNRLLQEAIPEGNDVRAEAINGNFVLRGEVPSAADAARAEEIMKAMLDSGAPAQEGGGTRQPSFFSSAQVFSCVVIERR